MRESGWWSRRGSSSEENVYPPVRTLPVVYQRCGSGPRRYLNREFPFVL